MKTFLERAKGSPLTIISTCADHFGAIASLSSHTKRIRHLNFVHNHWAGIQRFSETLTGPLPLLYTITIDLYQDPDDTDVTISPSVSLFSGAVNLKEFFFRSKIPPSLNCFFFPNLPEFELWTGTEAGSSASQLLDFLDASPMLRTVSLKVIDILPENVPQERIVVLPNVETISMLVNDGRPCYGIAAHVSCPSAKLTSFLH